MSLTVTEFEGDPGDWDRLVAAHHGTHFQRHAWLDVMSEVHGHETSALAARDAGGELRGVLPLVRVKSRVFGHFLVSMPYVNYGGPLGGENAVRLLAARAAELARESGAGLLELRCRESLPIDLQVSHRKITVLLDIPPGDPDTLFGGFKAKLRSQVRRPSREGVTTRFGADQVEPFYRVYSRHMRDLGTPVQPRRLFESISRTFGEDAWFACAWHENQPVACGCGFRWGREFEMTWASSLYSHAAIAPNMGLYWAFMERASREGVEVFNFGRCTPGSGTHRFKQQWGGRDVPLHWYQWSSGPSATPSPDDSRYSWGPRIWRRLPVPVANLIGPMVVRGIP